MPSYLNIDYATPLRNNERPFDSYLNSYYAAKRQGLAERRLADAEQAAKDRRQAAINKEIQGKLSAVSKLGQYGDAGLWTDDQINKIMQLKDALKAKIKNNDPSYYQDLATGTLELAADEKKAKAYNQWLNKTMENLSKNKAIIPDAMRRLLIQHTAFGPDGKLLNLDDLDLDKVAQTNPLLLPDISSAINKDELIHEIVSSYPMNTQTFDNTTRLNGITNQVSKTISAPAFTRVNPKTGKVSMNEDLVSKNPLLFNHFFDTYRNKNGDVALFKSDLYNRDMQRFPLLGALVGDEIRKYNEGKQPNDPNAGYIEPNSEDGDLFGRAYEAKIMHGQEHGNFKLRTRHTEDKDSGPGNFSFNFGNASKKDKEANFLNNLGNVYRQTPNYMQAAPHYNPPSLPGLGPLPASGYHPLAMGAPLVNVTQWWPLKTYKPVTPAKKNYEGDVTKPARTQYTAHTPYGVYVIPGQPGSIYIKNSEQDAPQRITAAQFPSYLKSIAQYNPGYDMLKMNKLMKEAGLFGAEAQKQSPMKKVTQAIKDTVRTLTGTKKDSTAAANFRNQFKISQ